MRLLCPVLAVLFAAASLLASPHQMAPLDTRAFAAAEPGALAPGGIVPNFRLTDHRGVTRELYYDTTAKATVLVFTSAGSARAVQTAAALRALRARFAASDVIIWQIDSGAGATSATIAATQTLTNNDTPVLIDDAQLVATELGVTRELETFVIGAVPFSFIAYRGPLDNADPASLAAPTENYAADAVAAVLAGRTPAQTGVPMSAAAPFLDLLPAPSINYATDVAPVVLRRCVSCHSPGNIAPHSYAKFDDLASRASSVRASLLQKRMSPWHADPRYGVFANELAPTPAEVATVHAWARAGAPRGTGPDPLATAVPPAAGWPLGQPDLVLTIPKQDIPATGIIDYRYITVDVPTTTDRWLRAAVVRPGNTRVVHHALLFEGSTADLLFTALTTGQLPGLGGYFAAYAPGTAQIAFPEGTGKLLKAGRQVTFQMHYTTSGQAETDQTQIGLYFFDRPPERELRTNAAVNVALSIPPGAREYERTASFTASATKDVMLYELNPHMHYRGKRFRFEAVYPNGTVETLLNVPQYDFAWQTGYRLAQPKRLPRGTVIRASGAFDNSTLNPTNPNPRSTVTFGEQSNDEMFIGYINYAELPDLTTTLPPAFAGNTSARGRVGESLSLAISAANSPTRYRADTLPAGLALDSATGVLSGRPTAAGRHTLVITAENTAGSAATLVDLAIAPPAAPVFTRQPASLRARLGDTVTLRAAVHAATTPTYTWYFRGGEFCNTDTPELTLTGLTAAHAGDYFCVAANATGTARSATATVSLEFSGLVNLSARARVGTGADVVIPGITVRGDKPKTLLIRAAGPALAGFGVTGTLANPIASVFNAAGERILANDNWGEVPDVPALRTAAATQSAFALPEGSRDAAMLVTLPPGGYTVQVAGSGTGAAAQGVALVEVYEADASPSTLVNLSCRARVGTGADILIAGFSIQGPEPRRLLIRAVGPTLAALGVTGVLADPKLELTPLGGSTPIASNDNWDASLAPAFASVGAFALTAGSSDAALVTTLGPGSYTVQVSGVGTGTAAQGVALVEVYELP
ncbi:MAG: immunoglobulin domain-containing protein [Opitutaceae bacterium]|nr:immunoglobulin domain-containing protein [Opitutaceae bacterium]